jgi:hypothetical protein
MADLVQVQFIAAIGDLVDGIGKVRESLNGIKETADGVTEGLKKVAEVAGIAFSVEGLKNFIETMALLGSQTSDSMARLGQSAQQITVLQGVAQVSGLAFGDLQGSIEKAALTIQKSAKDAINPAAQGLKALGLNARELIGVPADQFFTRIADAVSKFNPSLTLTSDVTAALGRNTALMLPLLLQGSAHFKELSASVRQAQDGLARAIPGMAATYEKIQIMEISINSLGARIFSVLKPAIDAAITSFTSWIQSIDTKTIADAVNKIVEATTSAMLSVGLLGLSVVETFATASRGLDPFIRKLEVLALGASIGTALSGVKGAIAGAGIAAAVSMFAEQYQKIPEAAAQSNVKLDEQRKRLYEIVGDIRTAFGKINLNPSTSGAKDGKKQDASGINAGAGEELAAAMKNIDGQIAVLKQGLEQKKILFDGEAALFQITQDKKYALLQAETQREAAQEMMLLQTEMTLGNMTVAQREVVENKIKALKQKTTTEMIQLDYQSIQSMKQKWSEVGDAIQSSFNSSLRGLLAGTTSWAQAFKTILGDMVIFAIQKIEKMGFEWAAKELAETTATTSGAAARAAVDVGSTAASETAKTGAVVTGVSARTAAETAGASISMATKFSEAMASIGASVAEAYAGLVAALVPVLGPAAPAGALAISAGVGATAVAMIRKFDVGTDYVLNDGLAYIHKGEKIIPAQSNGAYSGGGLGGGDTHFHLGGLTINGAISDSELKSKIRVIANTLKDHWRTNPSTRPAY